jgi:hypothetical protein
MGKVACKRHGPTVGPLTCDHIRVAIANLTTVSSLDEYRLDVLGDGTHPLRHMLCQECAARLGLSPDELIPEAVGLDESRYPYLAPACGACFREWCNEVQNARVPDA